MELTAFQFSEILIWFLQDFKAKLKRWADGHSLFVLDSQEKDSLENCVLLLSQNTNRFSMQNVLQAAGQRNDRGIICQAMVYPRGLH